MGERYRVNGRMIEVADPRTYLHCEGCGDYSVTTDFMAIPIYMGRHQGHGRVTRSSAPYRRVSTTRWGRFLDRLGRV